MGGGAQIRFLTLERNIHRNDVLYKLERGFLLRFKLGASVQGGPVSVYCSHPPASVDAAPRKNHFHKIPLKRGSDGSHDDTDLYAEVALKHPGPHRFCFFLRRGTDESFEMADIRTSAGSGYFTVAPALRQGPKGDSRPFPLGAVCSQTYVSKLLGPLSSWESKLRVAKASGYNVIHLTPVQSLDVSGSAYALKDHFSVNPDFGTDVDYADIADFTKKILDEWRILVIQDLVLNHTGCNTSWLRDNPRCVYNLVNSPHLKPAYVLDRILRHLSSDIASGKLDGVAPILEVKSSLGEIRRVLEERILEARIEEYFQVPAESTVASFKALLMEEAISARSARLGGQTNIGSDLIVNRDPACGRFGDAVDVESALPHFLRRVKSGGSIDDCLFQFANLIQRHNEKKLRETRSHLSVAIENVMANVSYRFLDPTGHRYPKVCEKYPLMPGYFYHGNLPVLPSALEEETLYCAEEECAKMIWAHNGWVYGGDALTNFAESGHVYFRRELVPWGDSVKLNYGRSFDDNPVLWNVMKEYTVKVAESFHGVRLDNCHSTPPHVAEFLLASAREVNPNLLVVAELFTGGDETDNVFINRLGIDCLVREAANCQIPRDLGALIYRHSGEPVGTFFQLNERDQLPSIASGIVYDQTHDNPSFAETRTLLDFLPTAAIVAMTDAAVGSNRGYDELVQHHIHVVEETRSYKPFSSSSTIADDDDDCVTENTGIIKAKSFLNHLHVEMARTGFAELYVDQITDDIVSITRHNPRSHQSIVLVAYSAFHSQSEKRFFRPMRFPGLVLDQVLFEASLDVARASTAPKGGRWIEPALGCSLYSKSYFPVYESNLVEVHNDSSIDDDAGSPPNDEGLEIDFVNFKPGDVIAFKFSLNPEIKSQILTLRSSLSHFGYPVKTCSGRSLSSSSNNNNLESVLSSMSLADFNFVLFHCQEEEKAAGCGGVYSVPGYGDLTYAGLHGFVHVLDCTRGANDLGHALFDNLRDGDWMLDYVSNRLLNNYSSKKLGVWFQRVFDTLRRIPRHLVPCYFDAILTGVEEMILDEIWSRMGDFVSEGSNFLKRVALASVQLVGFGSAYKMPFLPDSSSSSSSSSSVIPTVVDSATGQRRQAIPSLAAGLPHFAAGIFRSWGRDTFISLRGLLLLTRRFDDAKWIILSYGSSLRHGLIPNLLGEGVGARFNCRDAVWWWLQSVKDLCVETSSLDVLSEDVRRLYPRDHDDDDDDDDDDATPQSGTANNPVVQPLHSLIHRVLTSHWRGISFRERNAGPSIDAHMTDAGFQVNVAVDKRRGFVFGGNAANCGTWMDKMGHNGKPATPRDGAAVEIVALSYSVIKWLSTLPPSAYPHQTVSTLDDDDVDTGDAVDDKAAIKLGDWADKIEANFESSFWVPSNPAEAGRTGYYKDTVGASSSRCDNQLRPNFALAMVVAPDLFDPVHAHLALSLARDVLMGPVGIKTLDPEDPDYDGLYLNGSDNYHQGPEWLFPAGFFLRALLLFSTKGSLPSNLAFIKAVIGRYQLALSDGGWNGLPELTNAGGAFCPGSCRVQAWSHATILELLRDMARISTI